MHITQLLVEHGTACSKNVQCILESVVLPHDTAGKGALPKSNRSPQVSYLNPSGQEDITCPSRTGASNLLSAQRFGKSSLVAWYDTHCSSWALPIQSQGKFLQHFLLLSPGTGAPEIVSWNSQTLLAGHGMRFWWGVYLLGPCGSIWKWDTAGSAETSLLKLHSPEIPLSFYLSRFKSLGT